MRSRGRGGRCRPSTLLSIKNITSDCSLFCIKLLSASSWLSEHYLEILINHHNSNYETRFSLVPQLTLYETKQRLDFIGRFNWFIVVTFTAIKFVSNNVSLLVRRRYGHIDFCCRCIILFYPSLGTI